MFPLRLKKVLKDVKEKNIKNAIILTKKAHSWEKGINHFCIPFQVQHTLQRFLL